MWTLQATCWRSHLFECGQPPTEPGNVFASLVMSACCIWPVFPDVVLLPGSSLMCAEVLGYLRVQNLAQSVVVFSLPQGFVDILSGVTSKCF